MALDPSIGQMVLYVLDQGPHAGEVRAALIVRVGGGGHVNLVIFMDGPGDGYGPTPWWLTNVPYNAEGAPRTWHEMPATSTTAC